MNKRIFVVLIIFIISIAVFILYKTTRPKGLVAFVIDDWGYNNKNIDLVLQIDRPLTLAILPNLRYSKDVAEAIKKNSKICDIILHLPLEAEINGATEVNTIQSDMKKDKIIAILKNDIKSIPDIIGVSNHQGSRVTKDRRIMNIILSELKKGNLFFLDSMTTSDSVCEDIAHDIKLRFAKRDVFLDLTDEEESKQVESYIKKQIQELTDVAVREGSAIGIGHNKKITLEVLRDAISELERKGIKIVPLKKFVR